MNLKPRVPVSPKQWSERYQRDLNTAIERALEDINRSLPVFAANQLLLPNGTNTMPSVSFQSDPRAGMYLEPAGHVSIAAGGVLVLRVRNESSIRSVQVNASFQTGAVLSPAQITADQNNYNPADLNNIAMLRLNTDASRNITGIQTPNLTSRIMYVVNVGAFDIVLVNESASSTAGHRFAIGANITIGPNEGVTLLYDTTTQRWRCPGKHV